MKALSIDSYYATLILEGEKTVECRSWKTNYRGLILICANSQKNDFCLTGRAACIVELLDIVPFTKKHLKDACMETAPNDGRTYYAWILRFIDYVLPVKVKGQLNLFSVDDNNIFSCADFLNDEDVRKAFDIPETIFDEDQTEILPALNDYINNFRNSIVMPAYYRYNKQKPTLDIDKNMHFNPGFADMFFDLTEIDPHDIWSEFPTGYTYT